ncbi:HlyD family efflux transporter periplasmic adaptor subunit [uncultured Acetobacteroides sp.]|uniref:HlyD family efflux transporter periplasmic adaptor subunit n=1 Tax=uncultured Acetobacteroides sp. TaxID=1760811 RepID=UPI0029F4C11F|nr:HlyD family efflux transporter periplasmic adaptor subunit [uncultured Acetobacteroides sp.]
MPEIIDQKENEAVSKSFLIQEARSEEIQEIISKTPRWILRWGITVFLLILLLLLVVSWLVKYPETVTARLSLTTVSYPKAVVVKTSGKLMSLQVNDQQEVQKGATIGVMESIANYKDVARLDSSLSIVHHLVSERMYDKLVQLRQPTYQYLGELQASYQTFENSFIDLQNYLSTGIYLKKYGLLKNELQLSEKMLSNTLDQKDLQAKDLEIAAREYNVNKMLYDQKVIALLELKNIESKYLAKRGTVKQMESTVIGQQSSIIAKKKEIMELENQIAIKKATFLQELNTLKAELEKWKNSYLLTAPINGMVTYSKLIQEGINLKAGDELCYVVPSSNRYNGEIRFSQYALGKVAVGQKVKVKFTAYPYQEFGIVEGRVSYVSKIPVNDSLFVGRVSFDKGLVTNYRKTLSSKVGMTANAEIITKDRRLIERFFNNLRGAIQ